MSGICWWGSPGDGFAVAVEVAQAWGSLLGDVGVGDLGHGGFDGDGGGGAAEGGADAAGGEEDVGVAVL
jgi:hypothetical protein